MNTLAALYTPFDDLKHVVVSVAVNPHSSVPAIQKYTFQPGPRARAFRTHCKLPLTRAIGRLLSPVAWTVILSNASSILAGSVTRDLTPFLEVLQLLPPGTVSTDKGNEESWLFGRSPPRSPVTLSTT